MQNTSNLYQEIISGPHTTEVCLAVGQPGRFITDGDASTTFGGTSSLVGSPGVDVVYDESTLVSMGTSIQLFSEDQVTLGSCVSGEIDVTMLKPSSAVPRQARLVPYVRVCNDAAVSEWIQKGVYYLDTRYVSTDASGIEYLEMHGFDSMLKTEQDYPSSTLSWPAKDIDVVQEIATFIGVGVDSRTFKYLTRAYSIPYPSEYSCRETLGYIASMYAGCFIMSDLGELRFVPFYDLPKTACYLITQDRQPITFGGVRILV